jgi:hypothetical protein
VQAQGQETKHRVDIYSRIKYAALLIYKADSKLLEKLKSLSEQGNLYTASEKNSQEDQEMFSGYDLWFKILEAVIVDSVDLIFGVKLDDTSE